MRSFFEEHGLDESLSENRARKIKYSVLARVEGEKPMKKNFKFKPLVIAAAAAATMALSVVTVNGATNGAFISKIFRTNVIKTLTTEYGDVYIELEAYADGEPDEGKPSGTSMKESYSDDFSGNIIRDVGYSVGDVRTDDDAGFISVKQMSDGGAIGYKLVYRTGEILLLTDEEIQTAMEDFKERAAEVDLFIDNFDAENPIAETEAQIAESE